MYGRLPGATLVTVAGLTDYLKALLETDRQLRQVWVVGEVSSANDRPSGTFFTLSEADGSAALRCVVWSSQRDRLVQSPVPGEQVMVLGSLRLYGKRGEYQLTAVQVLPAGEGLQALRYRQLRGPASKPKGCSTPLTSDRCPPTHKLLLSLPLLRQPLGATCSERSGNATQL